MWARMRISLHCFHRTPSDMKEEEEENKQKFLIEMDAFLQQCF